MPSYWVDPDCLGGPHTNQHPTLNIYEPSHFEGTNVDPPAPSSVQLLPRAPRLLRRFLRWEARSHPKWHPTAATLPTPEAAAANTGTIPQKRQTYDQIISSLEHSGKKWCPLSNFPAFISFCFSSSAGAPTAKMGLCEHWGMPQHSNLMGNRNQNEVFKDWFLGFTMFSKHFKLYSIFNTDYALPANFVGSVPPRPGKLLLRPLWPWFLRWANGFWPFWTRPSLTFVIICI